MSPTQTDPSHAEPMTAERRAEIEAVMWRMIATAERAGIAALRDCLAEIDRLRKALEIIALHGGYTMLHPDQDAPADVQAAYSEGVTAGHANLAAWAMGVLNREPQT